MEDESELVECSFARDYVKMAAVSKCVFYKPIKLVEIHDQAHYEQLKKDNFCGLAASFELKDEVFAFHQMLETVKIRFYGLLASLTLYHFARTSKWVYYQCLDFRGYECCSDPFAHLANDPLELQGSLNGFEGKLCGLFHEHVHPYSIHYGHLDVDLRYFLKQPSVFNKTLMKYKRIHFVFERQYFAGQMPKLCSIVMHPGVEQVVAMFSDNYRDDSNNFIDDTKQIQLEELTQFLGHCKDVKTLYMIDLYDQGNPPTIQSTFAQLKDTIEKWSHHASRLEFFLMDHNFHLLQLQNHVLKRCVKMGNEWFLSAKCDFDSDTYPVYRETNLLAAIYQHPTYYCQSHDVDFVVEQTLLNVQNAVQES